MHPGARKITYYWFAVAMHPEYDNYPASLIFAKKATSATAYDNNRLFGFVLLHVNSSAIASVPGNVNHASPHRIPNRVADVAVNNNRAVVHGVANGVLRVAIHFDLGSGKVGAKRIARNAVNDYALIARPSRYKALPQTVLNLNVRLKRTELVV